jgi:hypothetical protein
MVANGTKQEQLIAQQYFQSLDDLSKEREEEEDESPLDFEVKGAGRASGNKGY